MDALKPPLSVDPGGKYFAWARGDWEAREVVDCGLHWIPDLHSWPPWFRPGAFHVICETQLPTKHDKAQRKHILELARMTGAVTARGATSELIEVNAWKGAVHKSTSHKEILRAMTPAELEIYHQLCNNYTGTNKDGEALIDEELDLDSRWDISHAIGILLYRFRRFVI